MLDYPTPDELFIVNNYVKRRKMSLVKTNIFRRSLQLALHKTVRPPTKKHLGTRLREVDPLPCIPELFHEITSIARGLPADSPLEGISRLTPPGFPTRQTGELKPEKASGTRKLYKIKLQRQDEVSSLTKFQEFDPRASLDSLRMVLKKGPVLAGKKTWVIRAFCMASQLSARFTEPMGKAATERFSMISAKLNVLVMDPATAQITFGVINYPPWIKKWLRWEMYDQVERLSQVERLRVSVPAELLRVIRERKMTPAYAMEPDWATLE